MIAVNRWIERHQFVEAGWTDCQVFRHPSEVLQGLMDTSCEGNPFVLDMAKRLLHVAEQASRSWQGKGHRSKFS